jgi:hypothetical protein
MKKELLLKSLALVIFILLMGISTMPLTGSLSVEKHISTKELICNSDSRGDNDTTPPVTTIYFDPSEPNGLNHWYVTDIEITLEATDDMSGVDFIKYLLDDNDWMIYTSPLIIDSDGYHRITYYAVDKAGNVEEPNEVVRFKLDKTKPVISMNYTWYGNPFQGYGFIFNVTATDAMSGMEKVEFYVNDVLQEIINGSGPYYVWELRYLPPCDLYIKGIAFDKAGKNNFKEIKNPTNYENHQNQSHSQTVLKQSICSQQINQLFQKIILCLQTIYTYISRGG